MSPVDFRKIEQQVLKRLQAEGKPVRTSELLRREVVHIPAPVLRRAIWSLVSDGKAEYTNDRRVRATVPHVSHR